MTEWYKTWQNNGWRTAAGKQVENKDIVENVRNRIRERDNIGVRTYFEWIKGHVNLPGNIEADRLAVDGARAAAKSVETYHDM